MRAGREIWFAASVILFFKLRSGRQRGFVAWENVYLVKASSLEVARERAEELGRAEANQESVSLDGKPATLEYGGIRKIVSCAADPSRPGGSDVKKLYDGVEATYSAFTVRSKRDLKNLIGGQAVDVRYDSE